MSFSHIFLIASRYAFGFGNGYLSPFLSVLSTLGLILAIGALTTVLSIMNGFDKELRERILRFIPHATVYELEINTESTARQKEIFNHPQVIEVEYFKKIDSLVFNARNVETVAILAFNMDDPHDNPRITELLNPDELLTLRNSKDGLVIGKALADKLDVAVSDELTLIIPERTGAFHNSTSMRLKVEALLSTGTQIDEVFAMVPMKVASAWVPEQGIKTGFYVYIRDIFDAPKVAWELANAVDHGSLLVTSWLNTHGNLYAAIQLSRDLVGILLFSVVTVAAFNVVASLVLMVMDKRTGIAVLRTLGASSFDVAKIFIVIGFLIGSVGVLIGSLVGILLSTSVPSFVKVLERVVGDKFLSTDVYPINFVPVDIALWDIIIIGGIALTMCVFATIYPAISASRVHPASVLKSNGT